VICFSRTEHDLRKLEELAIDPATLADDGRDYSRTVVSKPWGSELEIRRTVDFSAWRLEIEAGHETSMHCHPGKTTLLEVQSGDVLLSTLYGHHELGAGDTALIERGVFHRTRAIFDRPAVVVELEWPPNRRDLVRLADRYGRQGKGYEYAAG